jgi:hypothetical protein
MVARILPFLSTEQAADILMTTARNLPFLIKKDAQDEVSLPCGTSFHIVVLIVGKISGLHSSFLFLFLCCFV